MPKNKSVKKHEIGDIIFVKVRNNYWKLKQYIKLIGIVVLTIYRDYKALVGGFDLKQANLTE